MERLAGNDPTDRARAAELLEAGKLVAVPTETVYGLAANATDEAAVRRVFSVKGRPLLDPLIVHCSARSAAESLCDFPRSALVLADSHWPGPLTLVLPKKPNCPVADLVSAGLPTLAVRVPAHPVLRALLSESGLPLAAPSANPFGYVSPTRADHVEESLGDRVDGVLDGGPCEHGIESTIVGFDAAGNARLLRPGPIPAESIADRLGSFAAGGPGPGNGPPEAPGGLPSHYRPTKGLRLFPEGSPPENPRPHEAVLRLRRPDDGGRPGLYWLSENGDAREIARNLFDLLRKLDASPAIDAILAELPSAETGLFRALRDRLRRAAATPAEPSSG